MAVEPQGRGSLAWGDLPESKQLDVLAHLATRRASALKKEYGNVLSIGVGRKTKGGELCEGLCLGFLVKQKSDRARKQVPPTVVTTVEYEGRKRRVAVPTDVEELGASGPQLATNAADGVQIASPSAPKVRATGAICCLVRLANQPDLFVLSCHHVLTLSGKLGQCRVLQDSLVADARGVPYAQLFDFVPMVPGRSSQIDAAIALVQPGHNVIWNHSGAVPTSVNFGSKEPRNCTIYAPGRRLGTTFVKTWREVRLQYKGCVVQIAAAYQFAANTVPGDSGSPVIGTDGALYGMHFWGDPTRAFALSIPAGLLFGANVFGSGTLELA